MDLPIENKIEKANIQQIDLFDYMPSAKILEFDMKQGLWQEQIIREKEFRQFIKAFDWEIYRDHTVSLFCSIDAIVPAWAYMLISTVLNQVNATVYHGDKNEVESMLFFKNLHQINLEPLQDQRVMVKGCSNIPNPTKAYIELTNILVPVVKSLMFGEPCSAVPVFKRK